MTSVTIVMWVSFDVFRAVKKPTKITVASEISKSLVPTLDQETIEQIGTRLFLDDSQIPENIVGPLPTTSSISTPVPSSMATQKPFITPSPTPTASSNVQTEEDMESGI